MWKLIEAQERQNNAKREEERKKRMKERKSQTEEEDDDLETDLDAPEWLEKYIKYKFDLLNRTGKLTKEHMEHDYLEHYIETKIQLYHCYLCHRINIFPINCKLINFRVNGFPI